MARGRKPKNKIEEAPTVKALIEKVLSEPTSDVGWDVRISDEIDYFDSNLSYELTGYRPIDGTRGLDFDPNWFMGARHTKESTGKYCNEPKGGKAYCEFWD